MLRYSSLNTWELVSLYAYWTSQTPSLEICCTFEEKAVSEFVQDRHACGRHE